MTAMYSPRTLLIAIGLLTVLTSSARAQSFTLGPMMEAFGDFNPCTGEVVTGTAHTRIRIYTKPDASGGMHFTMHILQNGQGATADPVNPKKYQFNNEHVSEANVPSSGSTELTVAVNHILIRQGNDPNAVILPDAVNDDFVMKQTAHFTFNANGIVTVAFDRAHTSCPTGP